MAEVKFWEEMNPATGLNKDFKIMVGDNQTGATYYANLSDVGALFGLNSNVVQEATPTTEWENQDSGLFIPVESGTYNGVQVDLLEGFIVLEWDGDTLTKKLYATKLGTPIKIRFGDPELSISGDNTVITAERLQGMTDYPVSTTQLNNTAFRDSELTYSQEDGSVTILNFTLQEGEMIIIYPDATGGIAGNNNILTPIENRLNKIEQMLAPLLTGGRMWWSLGLGTIPAGWVEDESWRDYSPIHATTPDKIGLTTGSNTHTLTSTQQGTFQVKGSNDRTAGSSRNNGWWNFTFIGGGVSEVLSNGTGANQERGPITVRLNDATSSFSLVQKSKYGLWIKYVGV